MKTFATNLAELKQYKKECKALVAEGKTFATNLAELKQYKKECKALVAEGKIKNVKVEKKAANWWVLSWEWC